MNRIEKLIKEKCPNGVEYKKLSDVSKIETGKLNANAAVENGKYNFYTTAKEISKINEYQWDTEALLIAGNANVGDVKHYVGKFNAYQRTYVLTNFSESLSVRFLYYVLVNNLQEYLEDKSNKAAMTYIVISTLNNFKIPIPPIEIQEEIVGILDKFSKLEAELEAELELRVKQFNFWREKIIKHKISEQQNYLLNNIASVYDGTHSTPVYKEEGIPFISVENIKDIYNSNKYISEEAFKKYKNKPKKGDVFMTRIGSIGICSVLEKDMELAYYVSLSLIKPNLDIVDSFYLKHYIESETGQSELYKKTLVNAVPIKINKNDIGLIKILLPSLEKQKKNVVQLEGIEAIIDINKGLLPKEIALRKKQYEYYRNKLLTFDELKTN